MTIFFILVLASCATNLSMLYPVVILHPWYLEENGCSGCRVGMTKRQFSLLHAFKMTAELLFQLKTLT